LQCEVVVKTCFFGSQQGGPSVGVVGGVFPLRRGGTGHGSPATLQEDLGPGTKDLRKMRKNMSSLWSKSPFLGSELEILWDIFWDVWQETYITGWWCMFSLDDDPQ